jgi:hypothetical protein
MEPQGRETRVWETFWSRSLVALSSMLIGIGQIVWSEMVLAFPIILQVALEGLTTYVLKLILNQWSLLTPCSQISIHQNFRLNGSNYYTIFDLPIQVTNAIPVLGYNSSTRPTCDSLNNTILSNQQLNATGPPAVLPYSVPKNKSEGVVLRPHLLGSALVCALMAATVVL